MALKPMYDNMLVRPIKPDEKTAGGLYIASPDFAKSYSEGEVLAVGEGYKNKDGSLFPLSVQVGDTILYRKGAEIQVSDGGEDLFLLSEGTVLAIKS